MVVLVQYADLTVQDAHSVLHQIHPLFQQISYASALWRIGETCRDIVHSQPVRQFLGIYLAGCSPGLGHLESNLVCQDDVNIVFFKY